MSYFTTTRRGEIPELQGELNSNKQDRKQDAIKKVIAAMTVGKDVSSLFPHVIKCMESPNLELKKLVYLYIINYAKSQPDLAIMAVNSFRKDARNPTNPLIRALAVRTMGCIRVERITEYLAEPLKDALNDEDPYVRKTAAICVAKLYEISPSLVEEDDFLKILSDLLEDGNAMVVANSVAAIAEISEVRRKSAVQLNPSKVNRLLAALGDCNEWGQVYILDYLGTYSPQDVEEAESIIERVVPRLAHSNSAVVIAAVKVIMRFMDFVTSAETIRNLCRKLAPSLVSLIGTEPEMQYVALRCINLIIQKRPNILEKEVKVFFCKYNDPIYVKLEKLDVMVRLADSKNIDQVLHELKEYASEVDVEFVRKSVRAIGKCAVKLERAVDRCISTLLDLISLKVNYVVQEAIIVIRDVFRKYPNRYEMIIKDLFSNLENLDDPEAKGSMVWIIGEYSDRIDDADVQLSQFLENFTEEPSSVQVQLLTATVKLFLKRPEDSEELITDLLKQATEKVSNPDIRERAYIYWRLLSLDPESAKNIILGEKPTISDDTGDLDSSLVEKLLDQLGRLASIYQKPSEAITAKRAERMPEFQEEEEEIEYDSSGNKLSEMGTGDLLGIGEEASKQAKVPLQVVLQKSSSGTSGNKGLQIEMAFEKKGEDIMLDCKFTNFSSTELEDWAIQFNVNYYGLTPGGALALPKILPDSSAGIRIPISSSGKTDPKPPSVPFIVQMAVKSSLDIFYFQTPCMLTVLLSESGLLGKEEFKNTWQQIQEDLEFSHDLQSIHKAHSDAQKVRKRLEDNFIFYVAGKENESGETAMYFSCRDLKGEPLVSEVRVPSPVSQVQVTCKTSVSSLGPLFIQAVNFLLATNN